MKAITLIGAAVLVTSLMATSCANEGHENAKSINVDSSNVNGSAPVRYGPDDPADTIPSLETSDDTGRRANTSAREN